MSTSVSTSGAYALFQNNVAQIRRQLSDAQNELASGVPADYGLALGAKTDLLVSFRQQSNSLHTIAQTNSIAATRLDTTSSVLATMLQSAQSFMQLTIQGASTSQSLTTLQQEARNGLAALRVSLNANTGDQSIFGGENTGALVMSQDPQAPGSSADSAFQAAFSTEFGMTSSAASVSTITGAQVDAFAQGNFANLFSAAGWKTSWSSATDAPLQSRTTLNQIQDTSVSANDPAFAKLAQAFSMIASLPLAQMNSDAASRAVGNASAMASEAVQALTDLQARVGTMQSDVTAADQSNSVQIDAFTKGIEGLDPIDPYATSTRVTQLTTQLQTAYAMTAQLRQLSLAQYL